MKTPSEPGMNRTGTGRSPLDAQDVAETAATMPADPRSGEKSLLEARSLYITDADPVGTMPPVMPEEEEDALAAGHEASEEFRTLFTLLDKLGQRLAFERTGVRLYETVIQKFRVLGTVRGGPSLAELIEIRNDELAHFQLVERTIRDLGGDPTVQTPCADLTGVVGGGLMQALSDPRTTPTQCLDTLLIAEVADVDGWGLLIQLAADAGHTAIARELRRAEKQELEHVRKVRAWVKAMIARDAGLPLTPPKTRAPAKKSSAARETPARTSPASRKGATTKKAGASKKARRR